MNGQLNERLHALQLSSAVESQRLRDLALIPEMVKIVDNQYRFQQSVSTAGTDDAKVEQLLAGAQLAVEEKGLKLQVTPSNADSCTLDRSIYLLEIADADKISAYDNRILQATATLRAITAKYGAPADPSKFSPADLAAYKDAFSGLDFPKRWKIYINNLEMIRAFEHASELWYSLDKQDISLGGGHPSEFPSIKNAFQNSDDLTKLAINWWTIVDEQIPSTDQSGKAQLAKSKK